MKNIFSKSIGNVKAARKNWQEIIEFLQTAEGPDGAKFNQQADVPGTDKEIRLV